MSFLLNFEITKIICSIERILNDLSYSSMGKRITNKIKKQKKIIKKSNTEIKNGK